MSKRRYLRYQDVKPRPAGMQNQLRNLQWLMREAFMCDRLALLPTLNLARHHNFGRADGLGQWDKYFDLDASRLICPDGARHPLPIARELPEETLRTLILARRARMPNGAQAADLVVRPVREWVHLRDLPYDPIRRLAGDVLTGPPAISFDMRPSKLVRELAEPTIASIVTRYGHYAAAHVRRGDRSERNPTVKRRTEPQNVRRRLAKLGVPLGAPVFFLSDERNPDYWRTLGGYYEIVRYTDFPHLAALVDTGQQQAPDNYLLYEVEKAVMRRATRRLETIPGPNYAPASTALVSRLDWTLFNLRSALRRSMRRRVHHDRADRSAACSQARSGRACRRSSPQRPGKDRGDGIEPAPLSETR